MNAYIGQPKINFLSLPPVAIFVPLKTAQMKQTLILAALVILFAAANQSCKQAEAPKNFCDTACLKDSIKFNSAFKLHPYVYISARNCGPDTLIWSYDGMGVNRKAGFGNLFNAAVNLNPKFVRCVINDTSYAWLLFNDCATGRGFQLKLPYNKSQNFSIKTSGINNLDPKFSVDDKLVVSTDRGNLYVEDMMTGKKAMMTFGKKLDIDYDAIHEYIDSVNVTPKKIWVRVKVDNAWKDLEKTIELQ